jgi:type VI secretion system protein ImpF
MWQSIATFEPRVARASLDVQPEMERAQPNSVGFVIRGDLTAAARALPVVFRSDVEVDTGAVALWSE